MGVVIFTGLSRSQVSKTPATAASYSDANCSGYVTDAQTQMGRIVGAEEGRKKNDISVGEYVYVTGDGVKGASLNQEFFVVRPLQKLKNLGQLFADIAHVKIVDVRESVLVAQITFSCMPLVVGDWVVAPEERLMPPAGPEQKVDRFAPPSGKAEGQIVASKSQLVQLGQGIIVYLNVGADQGVQPGSVLRIFRYANEGDVNVFNRDIYRKYSKKYHYPREVLGECVVLKTGKNASTALITQSLEELAIGDHVEAR
jgi:hypothetical protein